MKDFKLAQNIFWPARAFDNTWYQQSGLAFVCRLELKTSGEYVLLHWGCIYISSLSHLSHPMPQTHSRFPMLFSIILQPSLWFPSQGPTEEIPSVEPRIRKKPFIDSFRKRNSDWQFSVKLVLRLFCYLDTLTLRDNCIPLLGSLFIFNQFCLN